MVQMQHEIDNMIFEYERTLVDRIEQRQVMIEELQKISEKSQQLNWAHEDIKRVKCAIDLAKNDIH